MELSKLKDKSTLETAKGINKTFADWHKMCFLLGKNKSGSRSTLGRLLRHFSLTLTLT